MRLNGRYTNRGLAQDEVARSEALALYLQALRTFYEQVKQLKVSDLQIRVEDAWLEGSFIKDGGRAGIYCGMPFDAVNEMQTWAKAHARNNSGAGYAGKHWSGQLREIYAYPSDLDVFVKYASPNKISITDAWLVDDKVKGIAREIFEKTGVFISAHSLNVTCVERAPIEDILNGKFQLKTQPLKSLT